MNSFYLPFNVGRNFEVVYRVGIYYLLIRFHVHLQPKSIHSVNQGIGFLIQILDSVSKRTAFFFSLLAKCPSFPTLLSQASNLVAGSLFQHELQLCKCTEKLHSCASFSRSLTPQERFVAMLGDFIPGCMSTIQLALGVCYAILCTWAYNSRGYVL